MKIEKFFFVDKETWVLLQLIEHCQKGFSAKGFKVRKASFGEDLKEVILEIENPSGEIDEAKIRIPDTSNSCDKNESCKLN